MFALALFVLVAALTGCVVSLLLGRDAGVATFAVLLIVGVFVAVSGDRLDV